MKRLSVAEAKAHFSEIVAGARRGKKVVILRHGVPAAAVVPVSLVDACSKVPGMTRDEALAVFESFAHLGDPSFDAVGDLQSGRR